jgi:hypothetical protein
MQQYILLTAIACAAFAQTQQTESTEPVDPKKLATLEGSVLNAFSGEAIAKVNLILRPNMAGRPMTTPFTPPASYFGVTNAEGKFKIERVEPGSYILSADRNGFVRQQYSARQPSTTGATLTITAGQNMKELNFKLIPQAVVTGRVLDEQGEPVLRARIQMLRITSIRGRRQLSPVGMSDSNDLGEFRIHSLAPGKYFLSASPMNRMQMGEGPFINAPTQEQITTYYPASLDEAGSRQIELAGGQTLSALDIRLKESRVFHIRGKLAASGATRNFRVLALPKERSLNPAFMFGPNTNTKPDGTFDVPGLPPGSYDVLVLANQGPMRTLGKAQIDIAREDVNGVNLSITEGLSIKGKLRIDGDIETVEKKIGRKVAFETIRLQFNPIDGNYFASIQTPVTQEGAFHIENASLERFSIGVFGLPPGLWVKAATSGGQDALGKGLDLSSGVSANEVEIVIGVGVGTLKGTVTDSRQQPTPGAMVTLFPDPYNVDRFELFRIGTTDQNGTFSLANVSPGNYKLYAWEAYDPATHTDPEFLKKQDSQARRVTVKPDTQEDLTLTPIPPN